MAARSIASLSISFGLVSIPVKLYSATESSAAVRFKWMAGGGARVRQQFVAERPAIPDDFVEPESSPSRAASGRPTAMEARSQPLAREPERSPDRLALRSDSVRQTEAPATAVVERSEMVKGYEFERGKFVLFTPEELKALEEGSRKTIDIAAFIPEGAVDPIYYDKTYYLTPDKKGAKPYTLLLRAMQQSGRCALAKWAWRSKEYVVQIRAAEGGLVLQQLLYADEVRSLRELQVDLADVTEPELQLAIKLIAQISQESYDPTQFVDEEKQRILAAVEQKIAGREVVALPEATNQVTSNVVDLMEALRASLRTATPPATRRPAKRAPTATVSARGTRRK